MTSSPLLEKENHIENKFHRVPFKDQSLIDLILSEFCAFEQLCIEPFTHSWYDIVLINDKTIILFSKITYNGIHYHISVNKDIISIYLSCVYFQIN